MWMLGLPFRLKRLVHLPFLVLLLIHVSPFSMFFPRCVDCCRDLPCFCTLAFYCLDVKDVGYVIVSTV